MELELSQRIWVKNEKKIITTARLIKKKDVFIVRLADACSAVKTKMIWIDRSQISISLSTKAHKSY